MEGTLRFSAGLLIFTFFFSRANRRLVFFSHQCFAVFCFFFLYTYNVAVNLTRMTITYILRRFFDTYRFQHNPRTFIIRFARVGLPLI